MQALLARWFEGLADSSGAPPGAMPSLKSRPQPKAQHQVHHASTPANQPHSPNQWSHSQHAAPVAPSSLFSAMQLLDRLFGQRPPRSHTASVQAEPFQPPPQQPWSPGEPGSHWEPSSVQPQQPYYTHVQPDQGQLVTQPMPQPGAWQGAEGAWQPRGGAGWPQPPPQFQPLNARDFNLPLPTGTVCFFVSPMSPMRA